MTGIRHDIGDIRAALAEYSRYSRRDAEYILAKQGGKFARELRFAFRDIVRSRDWLRQSLLDILERGGHFNIRDAAIKAAQKQLAGKKQTGANRQLTAREFGVKKELSVPALAAKREIGIRVSGRGVLSRAFAFASTLPRQSTAVSKFGAALSTAQVKTHAGGGSAMIEFGGGSSRISQSLATAFTRRRPLQVVGAVEQIVIQDIMVEVQRRRGQAIEAMLRRIKK